MRYFTFLIILLLVLSLLSCGQAGSKNNSTKSDTIAGSNNDKEQIGNLVKQVLKWHETTDKYIGFEPVSTPGDSFYVGMDLNKLKIGLKKLNETNFFDKEFLDSYNKIVLTIDKKIKNKELEWYVDDMPPFGDVDLWCRCQDYPYNNPWDKIEFKFISLDNDNATLTWTWGNSEWSKTFDYTVKVRKTNGTWKISYLQGFDINEFK